MGPISREELHWLPGDPPAWIPESEHEIRRQMERQILEMNTKDGVVQEVDLYDVNNLIEGQRLRGEDRESLLRVQREPRLIRSPKDTGVRYSWTEDGNLKLGLNDPTNEHLYTRDDLQLDSQLILCQACQDVFNYFCQWVKESSKPSKAGADANAPQSLPNIVVHHFNIFSLLAFATVDRCYLCQTLRSWLEVRYPAVVDPIQNAEKYQIRVCWPRSKSIEYKGEWHFVLVNPAKPTGFWNFERFHRMEIWPVSKFGHHWDVSARLTRQALLAVGNKRKDIERSDNDNEMESTSSPLSQALSSSWLHDCLANTDGKHDICNADPSDFLPTRLLDVDFAQSTGYVRIVCPAQHPTVFQGKQKWVTLSHCWGAWGGKNNPVTLVSNVDERMTSGIQVTSLPQTFQDALEVCRWLQMRWLWIDCLCIIQDLESDWLKEASLMNEIYQHGVLNLSANHGTDSSKGIFAERHPLAISTIGFSSKALKQSWKLTPSAAAAFVWMKQVPAFKRVWINRERQLARRVLHFNAEEIAWECCGTEGSAFASETYPNRAPFKRLFKGVEKFQVGALQTALKTDDEENYQVWNDLCQTFSSKALTKSSDMPIVLSSLAKEFAAKLPGDEYVAGLWRSTLPHSLAWTADEPKRKGVDNSLGPSWSWMSTGARVTLRMKLVQQHKPALLEIIDVQLQAHSDGIFGHVEHGQIRVRGFLQQLRISSTADGHLQLGIVQENTYRHLGPGWDDYDGHLGEVVLDEGVNSETTDYFCLPIMIRSGQITGLLLQKEGMNDSNRFRRVGWVELTGVYALKLRYRVANGENDFEDRYWKMFERVTRIEPSEIAKTEESQSEDTKENDILHTLYQYDTLFPTLKQMDKLEPQTLTLI